jgi:argininosuccinate lyase
MIQPVFSADVEQVFDLEKAVSRRAAWGGTAQEQVLKQIKLAKICLQS